MELLNKILIANRGEIALRIIRSAKKLAIQTVAIYTGSEKNADYVRLADEAVCLGDGELALTFLNIDKIIQIAISTNSQAIHPGYGFLSENAEFAKACEENKLIFIGPRSEVLDLMGSKPRAKELAGSLGIPVAFSHKIDSGDTLPDEELINFPVLIKASFGGGGKGMELVQNYRELQDKVEKSSRIALNYFGNGELFIEQFIQKARHVEVQILGDNHHNIIHLYERECSIQRNHQKIIEEAPAIFLTPELRETILNAAMKLAKGVAYSGAGTVEFLIDEAGNYYFMEMNPRIQVEHAVTEEVTGIDIVCEQLKIASGFPLSVSQNEVKLAGHSIELRVYAENPATDFTPSSTPLLSVNIPENPYLRIESDINLNQSTKNQFDPLLIKIIATTTDRKSAVNLLKDQIKDLNIIGPETNTKYLETILAHPSYIENNISVEFCKEYHKELVANYLNKLDLPDLGYFIACAIYRTYLKQNIGPDNDVWKYLGYWRSAPSGIRLVVDGIIYLVVLDLSDKLNPSFVLNGLKTEFSVSNQLENCLDIEINNQTSRISAIFENEYCLVASVKNIQHNILFPGLLKSYPETNGSSDDGSIFESGEIKSPLHGKVLEINIIENQIIKKGDLLMVIEAMKSENRILSPKDAIVKKIAVNVGSQVTDRMTLIYLEELR